MRPLLVCLITALVAGPLAGEVVAVNPGQRDEVIGNERVRDMFLGRISTWTDGSPVVIVLIDEPEADASLHAVTGRNLGLLLRGWKRLVYSGGGAMPMVARSSREALELVAKRRGAITILGRADPDPRWLVIALARPAPATGHPVEASEPRQAAP